jgi:type IV pilus assembly protein PilV
MKQRKGFTLISVIIAMVLLSVGIMALANSMFFVAKVTRTEIQRTQALQLASQYIEEVRARDPWTLATEAPALIDSTGALNAQGTFTRGMVVSDEGLQLLRVVLTVTPRNNVHPIKLTTLIFKVAT